MGNRARPRAMRVCGVVTLWAAMLVVGACGSPDSSRESGGQEPGDSRVTIGLAFLADGDVDAGLEQLAEAPEQPAPGAVPLWYEEAIDRLLQWRHLDEADSMLSMLGPTESRPTAFVLRTAHVARLRGLPNEAVALYEKVRGDASLEATAAEEVAWIHRAQGHCDLALAVAEPILERDADRVRLREVVAACLLDLGRPQDALAHARRLPGGATQATLLGEAMLAVDRPDSAVTYLQQAMQLTPRSSRVRYLLGRAFLQTDQAIFAAQLLGPLAQSDPPYDDAQLHFSQALRATGKVAAADSMLAAYEQVAAEREAFELRFEALLASKEGRLDDALHHLRQALERSPDDGNLHNDLGTVLARQDQFEAAEAAFLRAKELRPRDVAVYTNLLRLYERMGDEARAREARADLEALTEPSGNGP